MNFTQLNIFTPKDQKNWVSGDVGSVKSANCQMVSCQEWRGRESFCREKEKGCSPVLGIIASFRPPCIFQYAHFSMHDPGALFSPEWFVLTSLLPSVCIMEDVWSELLHTTPSTAFRSAGMLPAAAH